MASRDNHLKRAVQASLIRRIGLATLAVATFLGIITYLVIRNEYGAEVIALAHRQVARFNHQSGYILDMPGLPDHEILQREVEAFSDSQPDHDWGDFVLVTLWNPELQRVAFRSTLDHPHLEELAAHTGTPSAELMERRGSGFEILRAGGRPHIRIMEPLRNSGGDQVGWIEAVFALSDATIRAARVRLGQAILIVVGIVLLTALLLYPIIMELVRRLTRFSSDLLAANLETLKVVGSAVAKRDNETQAHSARVTLTAVRLGEHLGLEKHDIQRLIKGALLHDVGKIAIRDEILLKPGKLTDDEFSTMRTHVAHGAQIVVGSEWLAGSEDVVRYHHEKFDGSGYQTGLEAEEIPYLARIFAIADVFDALTSKRPYKDAIPLDKTMSILEAGRGSHFDPDLIDRFAEISEGVHRDIAGREDDDLDRDLREVVGSYFSGGMEALQP